MTDENPFAEYVNVGGETMPHVTITKSSKETGDNPFEEFANKPAEPEAKAESAYGKAAEIAPGFYERGLGVDKVLNDIGVGKYFPVFRNGKLSVGLPPNEELAKQEQILEDANHGVKNTLKEIATDPLTYLPIKGGLFMRGAKQAGISAALAPTTNPNQTLMDRTESTLFATGLGGITGAALHGAGAALPKSLRAAGKDTIPEASKIYEQAKKMGLTFTGKETPEQVWGKIQEAVKGNTAKIAEGVIPGGGTANAWPVGVNLAASQMYGATKQAGGILYEQAHKIGEGEKIPASDLVKDLDAFIKDMEESAPQQADTNFMSKLKKIRNLRDAITEEKPEEKLSPWEKIQAALNHGGTNPPKTLTGSQLIEIEQVANSFYGAKGVGEQASIPVNNLKAIIGKHVESMSPKFQEAYTKAKNYWRQNVIQNFEENKTLHDFWKPEDYEAYKAMGKGIELHPDVAKRVEYILDKIKTPADMNELKKALPPEMYNQVRAAKFVTLMDKAGIDSKLISNDKNYEMLVKTLANKPEDIAALDAIKTFTEEMNRRGINKELTPAELEVSDRTMDRAQRTMFSYATGHKLYALRHALEFFSGNSPNAAQGRLQGFAKEIAKSEPGTAYVPGALPKAALKPIATEEGKATQ